MAVAALIKFVQGATVGVAGQALFGTASPPNVVVSNANDSNVVRWRYEILSVPGGSTTPLTVQDGAVPTLTFAADTTGGQGGFLVKLTVFDLAGNSSVDTRAFGVKQPSGRFIPPFLATDVMLNFLGQLKGWHKYLEEWLRFLDTLAGGGASQFTTVNVVGAPGPPVTVTLLPGQWALVDVTNGDVVINVSGTITLDQVVAVSVVAPTGGGILPHTCTINGPGGGHNMQDPNSPAYAPSVQITTPVSGVSWQRGSNGLLNIGV